jgi:catechol 2,3-dioxygenase-like lactoylglutathione lyase family enzyme
MIGYTLVGTNDLESARAFYDALFGAIGARRMMDFPNASAWGVSHEQPAFGVCKPYDGQSASVGNGTMIAVVLDERAKVDALHAKALELGGSDEGPPGVRGDEGEQAFYAGYFRDPDGNKLCAFRVGPA